MPTLVRSFSVEKGDNSRTKLEVCRLSLAMRFPSYVNILKVFPVMAKVTDFAQISKSKMGHNSIIIIARIILLATHVCTVSGNVCSKFHVNILNSFRIMGKVKDFEQISKPEKGHNSMIIEARMLSLATPVCTISCNVCSKFHANILNIFRVMAKVNHFAQILKSKKGHNLIIIKARIMPLAMHENIVSGNACSK